MTKLAIKAERLGKRFRIGAQPSPTRLARALVRAGRSMWTQPSQRATAYDSESFWAFQDVSFELDQGSVLGVIGSNGAGKSTLLKVIARITEPTTGRFGIRGRVGSLLEVGTGFHPELTGRENIFLSGTLLGMSRGEVRQRFDSIVAFAETERFLDTPIKRYSSGMRVRLGFAVAAHLDPEILIVDEVLAVGDHRFQQKCLGRMSQFADDGRTILFVSHNMAAIQSLCSVGLLMDGGKLTFQGNVNDCVATYLRSQYERSATTIDDRRDRKGDGRIRVQQLEVIGGGPHESIVAGGSVSIRTTLSTNDPQIVNRSGHDIQLALVIKDNLGQPWTTLHSRLSGDQLDLQGPRTIIQCDVPQLWLAPGKYLISLWLQVNGSVCDIVDDAGMFEINMSDVYGSGNTPDTAKHGRVITKHKFHVLPNAD